MKRYLVTVPFSLIEKKLVIAGDEIYAEKVRDMIHVYDIKTRKYIGKVSYVGLTDKMKEIRLFNPKF